MYKKKKIIAIIPARSGSKRLKKKNIKSFNGKPLIEWTIKNALSSKLLDQIFVSTDSLEIKNISINCGLEIPFMRPKLISKDKSPTSETVLHVLNKFERLGEKYDYVVLLEPTSPLRKIYDIDRAIKKMIDTPYAETLVSLGKIHLEHPLISKKIYNKKFVKPYYLEKKEIYQSQQLDGAYFPYGVVYISSIKAFRVNKSFYTKKTIPYHIDRWQNYEIDDWFDFKTVENIFRLIEEKNG